MDVVRTWASHSDRQRLERLHWLVPVAMAIWGVVSFLELQVHANTPTALAIVTLAQLAALSLLEAFRKH